MCELHSLQLILPNCSPRLVERSLPALSNWLINDQFNHVWDERWFLALLPVWGRLEVCEEKISQYPVLFSPTLEVNQIICSWKIKLKVTNGITLLRLLDSVNENHNLLSLLCGFGEQLMLTHWCILYMKYLLSLCGQEWRHRENVSFGLEICPCQERGK